MANIFYRNFIFVILTSFIFGSVSFCFNLIWARYVGNNN